MATTKMKRVKSLLEVIPQHVWNTPPFVCLIISKHEIFSFSLLFSVVNVNVKYSKQSEHFSLL